MLIRNFISFPKRNLKNSGLNKLGFYFYYVDKYLKEGSPGLLLWLKNSPGRSEEIFPLMLTMYSIHEYLNSITHTHTHTLPGRSEEIFPLTLTMYGIHKYLNSVIHTNTHTHFPWESRLPVSFCSAVLSLWLSFCYITADCKMIPEVVIGKKKQGKASCQDCSCCSMKCICGLV